MEKALKSSEAQLRATSKYQRERIHPVSIHLRKNNEDEMDFYNFLAGENVKQKIMALYKFWLSSQE